jgi:acetylornithine deacetylase/succinyl-diaminopimelate desuccinylase-like protein
MTRLSLLLALAFAASPSAAWAPTAATTPTERLARDVLRELIEIDTTDSTGSTTVAAEAMAKRLRDAGFPAADVQVLGPHPRKGNLVARLRGSGARRPILFLSHLDVVEARREDWSVDPFRFLERDGYFYGRGTTDVKDGCAILVANFIRWKQEGFAPDRDLILALTADEEGGSFNGVDWLLSSHRDLLDAEYCINTDGGDFQLEKGRRRLVALQASEKTYASFRLEARNPGGHSSLPAKDNAIYRLAAALGRLAAFDFPLRLNEVTRAFFTRMAAIEPGPVAADMKAVLQDPPDPAAVARLSASAYFNALLRTTCVATQLEGGHAENALPQTARAVVNCRILPAESPAEVQRTLVRVVADPGVAVTPVRELPEAAARRASPPTAFPASSSTWTTCGPTARTSGSACRSSTRASPSTTASSRRSARGREATDPSVIRRPRQRGPEDAGSGLAGGSRPGNGRTSARGRRMARSDPAIAEAACPCRREVASATTRSWAGSAPGAWARCGAPTTRVSAGTWR